MTRPLCVFNVDGTKDTFKIVSGMTLHLWHGMGGGSKGTSSILAIFQTHTLSLLNLAHRLKGLGHIFKF